MKTLTLTIVTMCIVFLPVFSYGETGTIKVSNTWDEVEETYIAETKAYYALAKNCKVVQDFEKYCSYASITPTQCLLDYEQECGVPPTSRESLHNAVSSYRDLCGELSAAACRESLSLLMNQCQPPTVYETSVPCPKASLPLETAIPRWQRLTW